MANVCGLILNPANGRIAEVDFDEPRDCDVDLYALNGDVIAGGELDCGQHGRNASLPAMLTGYPRVHTLPGVGKKFHAQGGWGTALYAGACLVAHLIHIGELSRPHRVVGEDGDGVCSDTNTRENAADRWWRRASQEYGLARSEKVCGPGAEESVTANGDHAGRRATDAAIRLASEFVDGTVTELPEWQMTFTYRGEKCLDVDVLPYASVKRAGLVLASGPCPASSGQAFFGMEAGEVREAFPHVSLPALRAANVGYLAAWDRDEAFETLDRLLLLLRVAGGTGHDLDSMVERFNSGLDPGAPHFAAADRPKLNGAPRRAALGRSTPRPLAPMRPVAYGRRARPSAPAARRMLDDALRDVYAQRARLGWSAFHGAP